jgi:hypothetical protein
MRRYPPKSRSHPYTCDVARRFPHNRVRLRPAKYPPSPQFLAARGQAPIFQNFRPFDAEGLTQKLASFQRIGLPLVGAH